MIVSKLEQKPQEKKIQNLQLIGKTILSNEYINKQGDLA